VTTKERTGDKWADLLGKRGIALHLMGGRGVPNEVKRGHSTRKNREESALPSQGFPIEAKKAGGVVLRDKRRKGHQSPKIRENRISYMRGECRYSNTKGGQEEVGDDPLNGKKKRKFNDPRKETPAIRIITNPGTWACRPRRELHAVSRSEERRRRRNQVGSLLRK